MTTQILVELDSSEGFFARSLLPEAFRKRQSETRFRQEWKLTDFLYRCLMMGWNGEGDPLQFMREFKGPRYQRGMLSGGSCNRYNRSPQGQVVLTNHTVEDISAVSTVSVSPTFRTDGSFTIARAVLADLDYSGEWWSAEPEVGIGSDYAIQQLSTNAIGTWDFDPLGGDDTWATLSSNKVFVNQRGIGEGTGTDIVRRVMEIGPQPSGPADDFATITTSAQIE